MQEGSLPHQTWDSNKGRWVKLPNLNVTVSSHTADYTWAHPEEGETQPANHRPRRHRMSELPGWPTATTRPWAQLHRPHPGVPDNEIRQWQLPTHPGR